MAGQWQKKSGTGLCRSRFACKEILDYGPTAGGVNSWPQAGHLTLAIPPPPVAAQADSDTAKRRAKSTFSNAFMILPPFQV
jgi:hypothetical protein